MTTCLCFHRLCDSYDALPNCSNSKQTTPTTLHNPGFGSLNSQPMMNGSNDNSIYKCSSDCCSMERQQRHNHVSNNNNKRKQKTKHHHRANNKNMNNNSKLHHSPQEQQQQQQLYHHNHNAVTPDQNHANYEYIIGDESHCEDDENSCNLGKVTISENEETTEHDDDEIGNSYSCDDTLTDDAILSGSKRNRRVKPHMSNGDGSKENQSENSRGSGSADGETCCSCSDDSCVYEEPPSQLVGVCEN